jgi:hypothetical protein
LAGEHYAVWESHKHIAEVLIYRTYSEYSNGRDDVAWTELAQGSCQDGSSEYGVGLRGFTERGKLFGERKYLWLFRVDFAPQTYLSS